MSADRIRGDSAPAALRDILDIGGHWEQVFGGYLVICLPPGSTIDAGRALSVSE